MSKYTKVLEKIQEEKNKNRADAGSEKKRPVPYEGVTEVPESAPVWGRGITTLKNTHPDPRLVVRRFPSSLVAEQYRQLRTSLQSQFVQRNARVIMISSSIHSEGKTVTTANLASVFAELPGLKVAVIDADMRRGRLSEYMGFPAKKPGLTNLLSNGLMPKEVMLRDANDNLVVIPRGDVSKKASDLVHSEKFRLLLAELRPHFDYIFIDSPPIMSVADAGILGKYADGVLMIIQAGRTPKTVVSQANVLFKQAGVKMLGYVLTNVDYQASDYRYYGNYYDTYSDEKDTQNSWKEKLKYQLRCTGIVFRDAEERFNQWWEITRARYEQKKRLKAHSKENLPDHEPTTVPMDESSSE